MKKIRKIRILDLWRNSYANWHPGNVEEKTSQLQTDWSFVSFFSLCSKCRKIAVMAFVKTQQLIHLHVYFDFLLTTIQIDAN